MKDVLGDNFIDVFLLMKHYDERKVFYGYKNDFISEKLFSYLEFKVGVMFEYISICLIERNQFGDISAQKYPKTSENISLTEMKIREIQTIIFTHYISIIESSLREKMVKKSDKYKRILLNDILLYLYKKEKLNTEDFHLWTGIRHLRNAIVHYDRKPSISMSLRHEKELIIELEKGKSISSLHVYENFKQMRWMTHNIEALIAD